MKKIFRWIPLLAFGVLFVAGCTFEPRDTGGDIGEVHPRVLALMASNVSDYRDMQALASAGKMEVEDLEDEGGGSDSLLFKTIYVDTWEVTRSDGTVVEVTKIWDDADTPEDTEDDTVTVTRSFDIWNGAAEKMEKIVRPRRPELSWSSWNGDTLVWTGEVTSFVDGVKIEEGTITVTWAKDEENIWVTQVVKEWQRLDRNGVVEKLVVSVEEDGSQTKTKYRIRLTQDGEIIVHSFTYVDIEEEGQIYMKIIRDDRSYAIIRQKGNPRIGEPRITEYYTPYDILRLRVTETRDGRTAHVVQEFFNDDGELISTRRLDITFQFLGDQIIITKTFEDGSEQHVLIEETADGYLVNRNGFVFTVKFTIDGIEFYSRAGEWIGTVTLNDDGTWTVTYPDETEEVVDLGAA